MRYLALFGNGEIEVLGLNRRLIEGSFCGPWDLGWEVLDRNKSWGNFGGFREKNDL